MSKYELTISSNYVSHWGVVEGVREFFQNAIDEQNSNPNHVMNFDYSEGKLTISNSECKLSINSLLLGNTSKSDGKSIGQFGEGYKVAIVVLLREGKSVTIHNGNELWNTRIVNSRRYKDKVVVVETSKFGITGNDLIVEIDGITPEEWDDICESNLLLKGYGQDDIETEYGTLLTDPDDSGKLYVEGLYIGKNSSLKYGYDYKSKEISLNRDRNIISDFEAKWNASKILATSFKDRIEELHTIINSEEYDDARYIDSILNSKTRDKLFEYFKEKNGDKIPVSTQEEYDYFKSKGFQPIIVKETVKTIYSDYYSSEYKEKVNDTCLYNKLIEYIESIKDFIPEHKYDEFIELVDECQGELEDIEV